MPIQFSCTHCGKGVKAPDVAVGKKAKCPHCEKINSVPTPDEFDQLLPPPFMPTPVTTPTAPKPVRKLPTWVRFPSLSWRGWLVISGLTFLLTLRTPPSPWVLLHYLGLMFAVGLLVTRIVQSRVPKWSKLTAVGAALLVAWLWGRTDYYIQTWEKTDEISTTLYTDYVHRSKYRPFYRRLATTFKDGGSEYDKGEMSESGKQHGHWQYLLIDESGVRNVDEWYWYGEEITEGEWHLRNR